MNEEQIREKASKLAVNSLKMRYLSDYFELFEKYKVFLRRKQALKELPKAYDPAYLDEPHRAVMFYTDIKEDKQK